MKKVPLYSRSSRSIRPDASVSTEPTSSSPGVLTEDKSLPPENTSQSPFEPPLESSFQRSQALHGRRAKQAGRSTPAQPAQAAVPSRRKLYGIRARSFLLRHERILLVLAATFLSLIFFSAYNASQTPPRQFTQKDIDAAVTHTLQHKQFPSEESKAFARIQRSVVRVRQVGPETDKDGEKTSGIGTGVVIVDTGIILTNLHVVSGAPRVKVEFFDGTESDASVISVQPDNDLAVLQAKNLPDDLVPATLRSTSDLALGDKVVAVGFPFGIGPSASSGIVSGLRREYRSPEGKRVLTNLIQFDAAANPGNSGGPLVTMDGAVVGIVTAILNPNAQGVFIGIGFAVPIENAAMAVGESPF